MQKGEVIKTLDTLPLVWAAHAFIAANPQGLFLRLCSSQAATPQPSHLHPHPTSACTTAHFNEAAAHFITKQSVQVCHFEFGTMKIGREKSS